VSFFRADYSDISLFNKENRYNYKQDRILTGDVYGEKTDLIFRLLKSDRGDRRYFYSRRQ
jgi:hypothetical protein